ncbi:MAG TPA: hypothetical protein V6D23_09815 [Candidatus Obscuribacterales bacterium]
MGNLKIPPQAGTPAAKPVVKPAAEAAAAKPVPQGLTSLPPGVPAVTVQDVLSKHVGSGQAAGNVTFVDEGEPKVSEAELQWAQSLEKRVNTQGYQPTPEEQTLYQEIFDRLNPPSLRPVSSEELRWAMELEQKVLAGYKPTAAETGVYSDIARRVSAGVAPPAPGPNTVSQDEIDWAMQLEQKVVQGYQPNKAECARYQDIATRLVAARTEPVAPPAPVGGPPLSDQELEWAMQLQRKVRDMGYVPTESERNRYESIRLRQDTPHHPDGPSAQELAWATQLMDRMEKQGYQPNEAEIKAYQDIYTRYTEARPTHVGLAQAVQGTPPSAHGHATTKATGIDFGVARQLRNP